MGTITACLRYNTEEDPSQMVVTWSTMSPTSNSTAQYGIAAFNVSAFGTQVQFVDGGSEKHTQYIHRVIMSGLVPGQIYTYRCGSTMGWSNLYRFTAMKAGNNWSPRLVMFGDLGNSNAQSLPRVQEDTQRGMYDALLHIGDFAYDMNTDNARVGDEFMEQIEPIAATLPYMTCPGNHEQAYNFSHYKNRFAMPTDMYGEKMFYSFDIGPAHIISLSTEYLFYLQYGDAQAARQYEWLEQNLKMANTPAKRAQTPWIITMGHRPMYCSNTGVFGCVHPENDIVRVGDPTHHLQGFENLFDAYGVDVMLWAHLHSYERMWPVYNLTVYNGSTKAYTNPNAAVHITTGSAGCKERHAYFKNETEVWSAFRSTDYGYTRMHILNSTHLYWEQVSDDKGGAVIDRAMLIKTKHGPYRRA
ncbi:hypothetical protein ScPMuIL_001632 [Solemya velum]